MDTRIKVVLGMLLIGLSPLWVGSTATISVETVGDDYTYSDVMRFLEQDQTDQIPYRYVDMVCWDFAELLQQNANEAGFDAAVVTLAWGIGTRSHVINAFQTSDRGLIWVDVTGSHDLSVKGYDREVEPRVAGDTYLYEEVGGLSLTVTLQEVNYEWKLSQK